MMSLAPNFYMTPYQRNGGGGFVGSKYYWISCKCIHKYITLNNILIIDPRINYENIGKGPKIPKIVHELVGDGKITNVKNCLLFTRFMDGQKPMCIVHNLQLRLTGLLMKLLWGNLTISYKHLVLCNMLFK